MFHTCVNLFLSRPAMGHVTSERSLHTLNSYAKKFDVDANLIFSSAWPSTYSKGHLKERKMPCNGYLIILLLKVMLCFLGPLKFIELDLGIEGLLKTVLYLF